MQKRSQFTRNRILESAQLLFSQSGYETTGVAEICQSAGISKGAFYHHFKSKQDVFLQLLGNWSDNLAKGLSTIRLDEQTVPVSLMKMSELMRLVLQAASGQLPMFLEFWTQAIRDPVVWKQSLVPYQHYLSFFSSLVQSGIDEGSLKKIPPDYGAILILALVVGVLFQSLLDYQSTDWSAVTRFGMQMLLEGMQNKKT